MQNAKPTKYDHEIRMRDGAQFAISKSIKNNQFLRATANRIWLSRRPDRLRLMGEK